VGHIEKEVADERGGRNGPRSLLRDRCCEKIGPVTGQGKGASLFQRKKEEIARWFAETGGFVCISLFAGEKLLRLNVPPRGSRLTRESVHSASHDGSNAQKITKEQQNDRVVELRDQASTRR